MADKAADNIMDKIRDYFGDTSRSAKETREGLEFLAEEIDCLLDALKEDGN
jgi:hypothetical protein